MDLSRFQCVDEKHKAAVTRFKCRLCDKIALQPHFCDRNHFFCKTCIFDHLRVSDTCPVDGKPLSSSRVAYADFCTDVLSAIDVRCNNRRLSRPSLPQLRAAIGCTWHGPFTDLANHQSTSCPYRSQQCPACSQFVLTFYLPAHQQHCPQLRVPCDLCEAQIPAHAMPTHYDACPEAAVYCPNHCAARSDSSDALILRRRDVTAHLRVCPNRMQTCPLANVGCDFRGVGSDLAVHARDASLLHLQLIARSHIQIRRALHSLGADIPAPTTPPPS